jgi:hypothetical protein
LPQLSSPKPEIIVAAIEMIIISDQLSLAVVIVPVVFWRGLPLIFALAFACF